MPGFLSVPLADADDGTEPRSQNHVGIQPSAINAEQLFIIKNESDSEDEVWSEDETGQGNNEDDDGRYRSRPQLPQPYTYQQSLGQFWTLLHKKSIDVDAEYQREIVWPGERMSGLINSLMENYYIPPIILNAKPNPNYGKKSKEFEDAVDTREKIYVCVDGKQRLSSIRAFIMNMITCKDIKGSKWYFNAEVGPKSTKKVLSETERNEFLDKGLVVFEYSDLTLEQEEELFARVQMGMPLSPAEKMRAQSGPWQELAKLFEVDFEDVFKLMKDATRGKSFQRALACFSQILEVRNPSSKDGKPALKALQGSIKSLLAHEGLLDDATKSHFAAVFNKLNELVKENPVTFTASLGLRGTQTFAPVELITVTVLISQYMDTRNNALLLGDIEAMRDILRQHHKDLKLNKDNWKTAWDFIDNLGRYRGTVDGSTVASRVEPQIESVEAAKNSRTGPVNVPSPRPPPQPKKSTRVRVDDNPSRSQSAEIAISWPYIRPIPNTPVPLPGATQPNATVTRIGPTGPYSADTRQRGTPHRSVPIVHPVPPRAVSISSNPPPTQHHSAIVQQNGASAQSVPLSPHQMPIPSGQPNTWPQSGSSFLGEPGDPTLMAYRAPTAPMLPTQQKEFDDLVRPGYGLAYPQGFLTPANTRAQQHPLNLAADRQVDMDTFPMIREEQLLGRRQSGIPAYPPFQFASSSSDAQNRQSYRSSPSASPNITAPSFPFQPTLSTSVWPSPTPISAPQIPRPLLPPTTQIAANRTLWSRPESMTASSPANAQITIDLTLDDDVPAIEDAAERERRYVLSTFTQSPKKVPGAPLGEQDRVQLLNSFRANTRSPGAALSASTAADEATFGTQSQTLAYMGSNGKRKANRMSEGANEVPYRASGSRKSNKSKASGAARRG